MAHFTTEQAQDMLARYLAAEQALLGGKRHRFGWGGTERELTHEDLPEIRAGRQEWERKLSDLQASASNAPRGPGGLQFSTARFDQ